MRRYLGLALACATSCAPAASPPAPAREAVALDASAVRFALDSLSVVGMIQQKEQSVCVTRYRVLMGRNGRVIILLALGPSAADSTDSLFVWGHRPPCEPDQPHVHSHVVGDLRRRSGVSDIDSTRAANDSHAPFQMILVGGTPDVVLYGFRPPLRIPPP